MAENLFGNATPAGLDFADGNGIVLGTVFRSDINGTITRARFYRATTAPATVIGGLFTTADEGVGSELARVTFVTPVAGWNEVAFAAPVAITAGALYVAAYYSSGPYVATSAHFTVDRPNGGHLTAIQSGAPFANGRFTFPAADLVFPASSGNGAAYYADIVFEPAVAGGSIVPVGQATETDTATPIGRSKARTLGQVAEADVAQPIRSVKVRTLGQAAETSTAQPIGRAKSLTLGQAATADTATALVRRKTRTIGQAMEAGAATAVGRLKVRAVNQAAEVDSATPLVANRIVTPGALTVTGDRLRASVTGDRIRMGVS